MYKILSLVAALAFGVASSAQASTVASFGTGSTGSVVGGTVVSSAALSDTNNGAYFQGATSPASNWVWQNTPDEFASLTYTFSFDLSGYNLNTASLDGLWGIDNIGTVELNGNLLSSLPNVVVGNFNVLTAYGSSIASEFNQGINSLVFSVANQGGPGAFRASGTVTASPVPVPAAGFLLVGALGGLGLMRRRKKS